MFYSSVLRFEFTFPTMTPKSQTNKTVEIWLISVFAQTHKLCNAEETSSEELQGWTHCWMRLTWIRAASHSAVASERTPNLCFGSWYSFRPPWSTYNKTHPRHVGSDCRMFHSCHTWREQLGFFKKNELYVHNTYVRQQKRQDEQDFFAWGLCFDTTQSFLSCDKLMIPCQK